tara:strand:+ start:891 stop:1076 length:186 start_codon:yes stop_codon:yes gene_type:complete
MIAPSHDPIEVIVSGQVTRIKIPIDDWNKLKTSAGNKISVTEQAPLDPKYNHHKSKSMCCA